MKFSLTSILVLVEVFLFFVSPVAAGGLVPCGGVGQEPCQTCHVVMLINNVVDWLVVILSIIASIIIVYAGVRLVVSFGDVSAKEAAKRYISNVIIGYVLVLACWLLIDTGVKMLLKDQNYGVWNQVQCVDQPVPIEAMVEYIVLNNVTASGHNTNQFTPTDVNAATTAITGAGDIRAMVEEAARQAGLSGEQIKIFVALIHQESSMCRNMRSPAGALGCGQLLLSTARSMDPSATEARLLNDNAYNLALSARYYAAQLSRFGETRLALAAYNGGPGANSASNDCPGLRRWQCVWDSPGCYNTGRTDCTPNRGYIETRNYVANIMAVAARL
ncbi:MAG: transglycosylase SLT domain-containing protein [Candidatus Paceibacteria bacterium]